MTVGATALRANRDFRLLWIGQSLSSLGGSVSGVAFPLLVLTTTGSATKAGLVGLAANAPFVLLQLPLGAYVDRWNRRDVMLCADVGHAVALGSLAVALAVDHLAFGHIVAVAPLETSFFVAFRLAEGSSAAGSRPGPGPVGCGIALNQARSYGTSLAGDPLGGLLFGIRSLLPFAVDAISTIASLITIASVRTPLSAPAATGPRHLGREIREGLTAAWSNTFLRTASPLTAGSDVVLNGLFLITLVIATRHGASPAQVGVMLAIGGTGGMLGALTASALARRVRSLRLVVAGVAWVAVPLILLMAATTNPLHPRHPLGADPVRLAAVQRDRGGAPDDAEPRPAHRSRSRRRRSPRVGAGPPGPSARWRPDRTDRRDSHRSDLRRDDAHRRSCRHDQSSGPWGVRHWW